MSVETIIILMMAMFIVGFVLGVVLARPTITR
jgi:hypothetical protein